MAIEDVVSFLARFEAGDLSAAAARFARAAIVQQAFDAYLAAEEQSGVDMASVRCLPWVGRVQALRSEWGALRDRLVGDATNDTANERAVRFAMFANPETGRDAVRAVQELDVMLGLLDSCLEDARSPW
ncbi:MAG: hypothetical protein U1E73_14140 [Planctomycetota bacterium]